MKQTKNRMRTYIQGTITKTQEETVQAHMDDLGFGSASPGEFVYEAERHYNTVTAARDILDEKNQLPMHSHSFLEIFQYISDSSIEYLIGTHRYRLQVGDIVCIPPGICHQVLNFEPKNVPCVRNLIAVSSSFLDYVGLKLEPEQFFLLRMADEKKEYLGTLCEECVQEARRQELYWRDVLTGYVQVLLAQIVRNSGSTIKAERDGTFEKILVFVDDNIGQKITLSDTARHFFTSERTVTREFQKNLGISFYRYVTQRRLLMARNLIYNGIPLEQVCEKVGFADYPTFYRAFKKEYGISPRQMKLQEGLIG